MKNRNEDNVEITSNQRFLKLFVVDILHRVVKCGLGYRGKYIHRSFSIT